MKSLFKKPWVLGLMILLSIGLFGPLKTQAQPVHVSFQIFYDNLQPYGQWIDDPTYGYIWVPNVDPGFIPYATRGYWVPTPYGNTWVSDYPWGWATFHYGRWLYDDFYGWVWLPDTVWGPGWVDWRYGDGYYGWAPLGPSIGVSISIPLFSWVFVPQRHFLSHRVYDYYVPRNQVNVIINRTKVINNTYVYNNQRYYGGPRPSEIERATKSKVRVYQVGNLDRPGATVRNGSLNLYRPQVERRNNVAPSHAMDAATYKSRHGQRGMPSGGNQSPAPGNARPQRGVNPAEHQPHNQPGQTQPARQEQPQHRQAPQGQQGQAIPQRQPAQQPQQERQPHREAPQQRQPAQQPQQERQPQREAPQQRQPAQQPQQERQPQRQQAPPRQERQQQPQRQQAPPHQERQQQRESRPPRQERPQREQHPQKQRDGKSEDRHH